ncbi:hypothetical protein HHK36_016321 [Tetracentron sinense]|uniref:GINS subunit domain-containing protein n=1 Tax=Tetracentron sinense TaxID=13715 RepID=A0A834Z0J4_TETSI|nr:hypothetical protein HHK36_016321 [Tetracentron sinense]
MLCMSCKLGNTYSLLVNDSSSNRRLVDKLCLSVHWKLIPICWVSWKPPDRGYIMMNTDGSFLQARGDAGVLGSMDRYNSNMFDQVIKECSAHHLEFQSLMRKIQEEGLDIQTTRNADHFGAVIHHLSLIHNKRCLMAYVYNRVEIIQSLRWKLGPVLPQEIQEKLNYSEEEFFKNHSAALESYMSELELDLTVDMVPPKDPYIHVRVLDDIGDVLLSDQSPNLACHSMHFLKRTDAEQFISQGLMEELTG